MFNNIVSRRGRGFGFESGMAAVLPPPKHVSGAGRAASVASALLGNGRFTGIRKHGQLGPRVQSPLLRLGPPGESLDVGGALRKLLARSGPSGAAAVPAVVAEVLDAADRRWKLLVLEAFPVLCAATDWDALLAEVYADGAELLGASDVPLTVSDVAVPGNPLVFGNAAFRDLVGYDFDEFLGRNCRFLQGPASEPEALACLSACLQERQDCEVVLTNYRKNGQMFRNLVSFRPLFDADGGYRFVLCVQHEAQDRDILERRRNLRRLDDVAAADADFGSPAAAWALDAVDAVSFKRDVRYKRAATGALAADFLPQILESPGGPQFVKDLVKADGEADRGVTAARDVGDLEDPGDFRELFVACLKGAMEHSALACICCDVARPGAPIVFANDAFLALAGAETETDVLEENCRLLQCAGTRAYLVEELRSAVRGAGAPWFA
ncbi:PAS domain-containing protein [Aureococcus anophagefferens]|nr:PAS domain-containing protein [Aureococcus anophagefferens]